MKALSNRKLKVSHPQGFKSLGVGECPMLSLSQKNLQWSVSIWLFSPFIIFLFQLGCVCKREMNQVENTKKKEWPKQSWGSLRFAVFQVYLYL